MLRRCSSLAVLCLAVSLLPAVARADVAVPVAGFDLSHWQHDAGPLDWPTVRTTQGFAIAKATDGATFVDPTFADNVTQARAQGLTVGSYHFAEPQLPMTSAVVQADFYAATIGNVQAAGTLPPVLDLETRGSLTTVPQLVTWTQAFLDELMARTGRTPVVYTGRNFWATAMGGSTAFSRFPLWIVDTRAGAAAPSLVGGWTTWSLWQWTATGTVGGVTGAVDQDRFNGDATALAAFADGSHPTVLPAAAPQPPVDVVTAVAPAGLTVGWQPADDGGRPVTSATVTLQPGGATVTVAGTETSAVLTGLDPAVAYTATLTTTNAVGSSPASAPSAASSPAAAVTMSSAKAVVQAGHTAVLSGTFTRAAALGGPAAARLELWAKRAGTADYVPVHALTTSATGSYALTTKVSATTRYSIRYEVGPGWSVASAPVLLTAQAAIKASLNHRTAARRAKVVLSGAVSAVAAGRLVYRQRWYSGAWHNGPAARVGRTGHFSFTLVSSSLGTSKLRVVLPSTPALRGVTSAPVLLTVH